MQRPRPLGSPSARTRTREAHANHGKPQPSPNPAILPPAHREQIRAYVVLNTATHALTSLSHPDPTTIQPVEAGTVPRFTVRDDRSTKTTPSLALYYENREVDEWVQSVAGVLDQGWNDQCVRPPYIIYPTYATVTDIHNVYTSPPPPHFPSEKNEQTNLM